jgi:hypothetical protein
MMKELAFPCSILILCLVLSACRSDRTTARPCGPDRAAAAAQARQHPARKYAVLVNADLERRHRRNISLAYETLTALGFPLDRIYVLSPRDSRRPPQSPAVRRLAPSPENVSRVLDELARRAEPGDLVVFYGTGHGDTSDEGESLLELRRGELWALDLRDQIERLRSDNVIVLDQCYSGGFAEAFDGIRSRVIVITNTDRDHMTDCYYFARAFWRSFREPAADSNHDGRTSLREAFETAIAAHRKALAADPDPELSANGSFRSFNGFADAFLNESN